MQSTLNTLSIKDHTYLREYVTLLVELQEVMAAGNEEAADRIRDLMDAPSLHLTGNEVQWVNGLSADLYSLSDEEIFESNPYSPQDYWARMEEVWSIRESDPNELLKLLRFKQDRFSSASVAYLRGSAYRRLGFLDIETLFMRLASELDTREFTFKIAFLASLNSQKRFTELDGKIEELLADNSTASEVIIFAVSLSVMRIHKSIDDKTRSNLGRMRQRLQRVFNEKSIETFDMRSAVTGLHTLATIQDKLHRSAEAQRLYRQVLDLDPSNQAAQVSLALSLLPNNATRAHEIFNRVAAEGTPFAIAYLFAARDAGERGQFAECAALAQKVIETTKNTLARAQAYEFLAISEVDINGPTEKARDYFLEALRLAPDLSNLQANYDVFQAEWNRTQIQSAQTQLTAQEHFSSRWISIDVRLIETPKDNFQPTESTFEAGLFAKSTTGNRLAMSMPAAV